MATQLGGRPRPYLRPDDRRRQLLDATARLFVGQGYGGMTMVAVAAEAGVSRRLVYDHFPDLPALYDAFFTDRISSYLASIDDAFAAADGSLLASFTGAFARLLEIPAGDQRAIRLVVADPGLPDLEALGTRFRTHIDQRWLPFFEGSTIEPELARALVWTLVHGFLGLADLVARDEVSPATATKLATALLVEVPRAVVRNGAHETPRTST